VRLRHLGLRRTLTDVITGRAIVASDKLDMAPCQLMVLVGRRG
jgi:hypothetical protein